MSKLLNKEGSNLHTRTPDGLLVYHIVDPYLPLMVSASEHNEKIAVLTARLAALEREVDDTHEYYRSQMAT